MKTLTPTSPEAAGGFRPLLTVKEVMHKLKIRQTLVYRLMSEGQLKYVKVGRTRRIMRSEVEQFMRKNTYGVGV